MDLRLLGPLEAHLEGRPIELGPRKQRAVLAMLALELGRTVSTDRLAEGLWGETPPSSAPKMVQLYVSRLRRVLDGDGASIVTRGRGYELRLPADDVDAVRFERLVDTHPRDALALWHGAALADLADEPFAAAEIRRLEELRLRATELAIDADLAAGRHAEVIGELERLVAVQPLREHPHAQRMLALYRSGRQADALEAYREARAALVEQIGVEPGAELRQLQDAILAHDPALDVRVPSNSEPAARPQPSPRGPAGRVQVGATIMLGSLTTGARLPSPGTSFIGRETELAGLAGGVAAERLVTLHGAGGAGKTRLAVELANRATEDAAIVDLGRLPRESTLLSAVAQALAVHEEPGVAPADSVARRLADRELLLVLDNCEHVLDGAREVATRVLEDCPGVTVLATSREPLFLPAELVWPVPPLSVPPETAGLAEVIEHDAGRLFVERAARALPGFSPREDDAGALARICRRLDGIPLAIELAAARVKVLGPEEIAQRLDDRFRLLAREDSTRPARQRTLRALVEWSYELLGPAERLLLARLSVFAGGFELDAAESVCPGDGVGSDEVVDLVANLVDKALVARGERDGRARFRLHETIREYARERLSSTDHSEAVDVRHLDWCRALAAEADEAWMGEGGPAWLDRALAEQDNVRQALEWGLGSGRGEHALDLAWRFTNFWLYSGWAEEAAGWLVRCLESTADSPVSVERARALTRAGTLAVAAGQMSRARGWYEEALAIGTRLEDPVRRGVALLSLADVDRTQGRMDDARLEAEEGLRVIRESGDRERIRWLVDALGRIDLAEGDAQSARERFEASRTEAVALGNETMLATTTRFLGEADRQAGDRVAARLHLEEALGLARRHGEREAEAEALLSLGRLDLDGGEAAEAHSKLGAALRVAEDAGVRPVALDCLDALAHAKAEGGDAEGGAGLLGAVEALREMLGTPPEPRERARLRRLRATLEAALGSEPFAAALGAGRARSWSEAVAEALRAAEPAAPPRPGTPIDVLLRRKADMWALSRPGRDVMLRDSKGLRYLAALIDAGGRELHVLELAGAGLDEPGSEQLDEAARSAYRQRLAELEEELDEAERFADPERLARSKNERDALVAELSAAVGLGGRARRSPSSVERARKAVSNRVRDALARIEREDPELGEHLRGSVRLGSECSYRPESRSVWSLRVA